MKELPRQFGDFTLQEVIGLGGMGVVYRAVAHGIAGIEKTVALKTIAPTTMGDFTSFAHELVQEAKLSVLLDHPNIIQVHNLGEVDGTYYV
ncbi:protein kinase, partial [Myxococcota bacterium]